MLRLSSLYFPLKQTFFNNRYGWKNSNLFSNLRHNGVWQISSILWYQISYCLCFCEWIWESKVTIGNTYKDCKKLQYFVSGISIAAVCFQELGNGECVTHAQTAPKLWSEVTPVKIYFIYSLNGEWKNILTLHAALDNNANMPGFTSNIKVMLERTRKDNFFLNQKVIIHYYVKSRSTQVPLLFLSMINFWTPDTHLQADITAWTWPVLIPRQVPDVLLWGYPWLSPQPAMLPHWVQKDGIWLGSYPTSP